MRGERVGSVPGRPLRGTRIRGAARRRPPPGGRRPGSRRPRGTWTGRGAGRASIDARAVRRPRWCARAVAPWGKPFWRGGSCLRGPWRRPQRRCPRQSVLLGGPQDHGPRAYACSSSGAPPHGARVWHAISPAQVARLRLAFLPPGASGTGTTLAPPAEGLRPPPGRSRIPRSRGCPSGLHGKDHDAEPTRPAPDGAPGRPGPPGRMGRRGMLQLGLGTAGAAVLALAPGLRAGGPRAPAPPMPAPSRPRPPSPPSLPRACWPARRTSRWAPTAPPGPSTPPGRRTPSTPWGRPGGPSGPASPPWPPPPPPAASTSSGAPR